MSENAVSEKQTSRRGRWAALAGGGLVVLLGAGYVGTAAAVTNKVPDGTKVAGVDVSGMSSTRAADAVEKHTSGLLSRPVTVNADGKSITLDPEAEPSAKDMAEVVEHVKGPKIRIHKFKNKTGYHKRQGHRQKLTVLKVTGIK